MALTTTTEIATPVDVDFQITLLRNAKALCPYYEGTVPAILSEHQGTFTAKWRRIENLAVPSAALTELTGSVSFPTRQAVQPSVTDVTAVVSKFGNFIYLSEEVDLGNFTGQTDKLIEVLGINAGQALNRQQRNNVEDNSTAILAGGATTATDISGGSTASSNLKQSDVSVLVNALQRLEALKFTSQTTGSRNIGTSPIRASFIGICHTDAEEDVRQITGFNPVETYSSQTEQFSGEFGNVGGVRFISTTESSIDTGQGTAGTGSSTSHGRAATSGRTDIYNTAVYGMDALGSLGFGFSHVKRVYRAGDRLPGVQLISHAKGSAGSADPLNELASMGWKSWHASVVLNPDWTRVFRHSVDRLETNE